MVINDGWHFLETGCHCSEVNVLKVIGVKGRRQVAPVAAICRSAVRCD